MSASVILTTSERETEAAGETLGRELGAGSVVLLTGPLGAGKTAFARGLAAGLGCSLEGVSSPTFTIIQEYSGPVPMQHVDLYRLAPHEVDDLLLEDLMEGAVLAVEWPDRWQRAPVDAVSVDIVATGDTLRRLTIQQNEPRASQAGR